MDVVAGEEGVGDAVFREMMLLMARIWEGTRTGWGASALKDMGPRIFRPENRGRVLRVHGVYNGHRLTGCKHAILLRYDKKCYY